jgi:hypothetical protein
MCSGDCSAMAAGAENGLGSNNMSIIWTKAKRKDSLAHLLVPSLALLRADTSCLRERTFFYAGDVDLVSAENPVELYFVSGLSEN